MAENIILHKNPRLANSEDYHFLRQKGMEYIEALGNKLWTDYNIHDPGITLLELLCYAITDLGYRTSFDIKDILAAPNGAEFKPDEQAFFTAREILTLNPWTVDDYRKLLIDVEGIKNAWLFCKQCPCDEMFLYANCAKSMLQYSPATEHKISIKGFYDVLLEFEDTENAGDLNSGKIKYNFSFITNVTEANYSTATIEIRLPSWHTIELDKPKYKSFRNSKSEVVDVDVKFISGNKEDDADIHPDDLKRALRRPLYITIDVVFAPDSADKTITETLKLEDIPFTVWFKSDEDRKALQLIDIKNAVDDSSASGILSKYLEKIKIADEVIAKTKFELHEHRNLCEDFCSIKAVEVEDIAICADMDVTPDADIEKVLAQAYYLISQYFSPDIKFYSLKELLEAGTPVEEIFEGPKLNNGFIDNEQLESTQLKRFLHTSDIINLLMDIPGVTAIRNLVLVRYDDEGRLVENQSWTLEVRYNHQPRLYIEGSKFLVFKNGLPFLPDRLELADTLQVIRGINSQPKYAVTDLDLPVPQGDYYPLNQYHSIQNSLPLTYGVGKDGLPLHVSTERKAQAKQLKAYLLLFDQFLINYLEQLSKVKNLFSLNLTETQSYYSQLLNTTHAAGIEDVYALTDIASLNILAEDKTTYLDRKNRFLNHLMARFAEQFNNYALMLYSYVGNKKVADEVLIKDKILFLKEFPFMSSNRAKAFNYKNPALVCSNENIAGLKKRIERLLGFKQVTNYFELYEEFDIDNKSFERRWRLVDSNGKIYISGSTRYVDEDILKAEEKAQQEIKQVLKFITQQTSYEIRKEKKWVVNLKGAANETIATRKQAFKTEAEAIVARDEIIAYAKQILLAEKIFVVEHLLLRPRYKPEDSLLTICISSECEVCGEDDPYSFRLTIILNGEAGLANEGIAFRRFAEETIRLEIPAHLGLKICWISNQQMEIFEPLFCDWLAELAKEEPDKTTLTTKLTALLAEFVKLKSIYPKAYLHDCQDGNDENRVYLNQTIV